MSKPTRLSEFKPISELVNYQDETKYCCTAVVFSPETENDHFNGCPPYIEIEEVNDYESNTTLYFEVPQIVAYYAKTHPCYTMKGRERNILEGRRQLAQDLKMLLNV